ncbi:unnamed protein product [Closterium sp. NIES-54]
MQEGVWGQIREGRRADGEEWVLFAPAAASTDGADASAAAQTDGTDASAAAHTDGTDASAASAAPPGLVLLPLVVVRAAVDVLLLLSSLPALSLTPTTTTALAPPPPAAPSTSAIARGSPLASDAARSAYHQLYQLLFSHPLTPTSSLAAAALAAAAAAALPPPVVAAAAATTAVGASNATNGDPDAAVTGTASARVWRVKPVLCKAGAGRALQGGVWVAEEGEMSERGEEMVGRGEEVCLVTKEQVLLLGEGWGVEGQDGRDKVGEGEGMDVDGEKGKKSKELTQRADGGGLGEGVEGGGAEGGIEGGGVEAMETGVGDTVRLAPTTQDTEAAVVAEAAAAKKKEDAAEPVTAAEAEARAGGGERAVQPSGLLLLFPFPLPTLLSLPLAAFKTQLQQAVQATLLGAGRGEVGAEREGESDLGVGVEGTRPGTGREGSWGKESGVGVLAGRLVGVLESIVGLEEGDDGERAEEEKGFEVAAARETSGADGREAEAVGSGEEKRGQHKQGHAEQLGQKEQEEQEEQEEETAEQEDLQRGKANGTLPTAEDEAKAVAALEALLLLDPSASHPSFRSFLSLNHTHRHDHNHSQTCGRNRTRSFSPSPRLLLLPRMLHAAYASLSDPRMPDAAVFSLASSLCQQGALCDLPSVLQGHGSKLPVGEDVRGEEGGDEVWRAWAVRESAQAALGFIASALERGGSGGQFRELATVRSQPSVFVLTSKEAAGLAQIVAAELSASDWLIKYAVCQKGTSKQQVEGSRRDEGGTWEMWRGAGLREGKSGEEEREEEGEERRRADEREVVLVQVLRRAGGFLEAADDADAGASDASGWDAESGGGGGGSSTRAGQTIVKELCRLAQQQQCNNRQNDQTHQFMVEAAWKLLAGLYCTAPDALSRHLPASQADWKGRVASHAVPERYARASETLSSLARALQQLVQSCLPETSSGQETKLGADISTGVGGEGVGGEKGGEGERESGRKRKLEEEEEAEREKEKERERERKTASTLLHLRGMAVAHPMLVVPLLPMLAAQLKVRPCKGPHSSSDLPVPVTQVSSSQRLLLCPRAALRPPTLQHYLALLQPSHQPPLFRCLVPLSFLALTLQDLIPLVTCSSQSLKSAAVNAFSSALVLLSALQPSLLALYNRSPSATTTTTTTTTVSTTAAAATASSSRSSSSDVLAVVVQPYLDLLLTLKLRDKPTVVRLVAQLSDFLLRCCSHSAAADMHVGMNGAMHAQAHMASHGAMRADTQTDTHPSQQAGSHLRSLELVRAHRGGALAHAAKHFGKVKKLKLLLATLDAGGKLSVEGEGAGEEGNQSLGKWLDLRARLVSVLQGSASGAWVGDEWWLSGDDATAAAGAAAGIAAAQAAGEGAHVEAVMGVLQEVESLAAQQPARLSLLQQPLCLTLLCCPLPHSPSLPPSLAAAGGGVEGRVDGGMVVDMVLRLLERMLLHAYR